MTESAPALPVVTASEGTIEAQLLDLYEDREALQRELGVSTADELIAMVRSMEEQLNDLYSLRDSSRD